MACPLRPKIFTVVSGPLQKSLPNRDIISSRLISFKLWSPLQSCVDLIYLFVLFIISSTMNSLSLIRNVYSVRVIGLRRDYLYQHL